MESALAQIAGSVSAVLVAALLTWVVGARVSDSWEDSKRRGELDLETLRSFYSHYGEFFAAWKLWDSFLRVAPQAVSSGTHLSGRRRTVPTDTLTESPIAWGILERSQLTEGGLEAILVKQAAERSSSQTDRLLLAAFRQAVQALRESIREGRNLDFLAQPYLQGQSQAAARARLLGYRRYRAFKALSAFVATMLSSSSAGARSDPLVVVALSPKSVAIARPSSSQAAQALVAVTATAGIAPRWWEIAERELHLPVIPQH
jgi:hypothetical protein